VSTAFAKPTAHLKFLVELFKDTMERFSDNEGSRLVAAFSYYATFSIFPLMLLAVTVMGFVLGDSAPARERMLAAIAAPGSPVRDVLEKTLTAMQGSQSGRGISAVVGLVSLLFAASGAFVELDSALNRIWGIPPRKSEGLVGSIRVYIAERMSGFAIVGALGLTLLVSLVSSSLLEHFADQARARVSIPLWPALVRTAELSLSIVIMTAVFTAAFHFIPRSRPPVRPLIGGALLTTIFLMALKELFAAYLSHLTSYSAYGVVGGVLALVTWIYLSTVIIMLGAQLTRVHAEKLGAAEPAPAAPRSTLRDGLRAEPRSA
jgi:membrane protein